MRYFSTNRFSADVTFREAVINGQPPDKGLYFPNPLPRYDEAFLKRMKEMSKEELALYILKPFTEDDIPEKEMKTIIEAAINFEFPLVEVEKSVYALELFHGPTLAFKDVGARFMSGCLKYFLREAASNTTILVATSGDTGGAVADAFAGVEHIDVVILYPAGKVSGIQEKQLTTYGGNVQALQVAGNFDDCQRMVKQAFTDDAITRKRTLTSANSINVARWLSQQLYYFFALQQWPYEEPPVISVPSGNFGNICAGLLARFGGLPVQHFNAACNANDAVPQYIESGAYEPKETIATISNAMDVGAPSNFVRILEIFEKNYALVKSNMSAFSIDDDTTRETIRRVYEENKYILDPHGAVAYTALQKYREQHGDAKGIFLHTAHPIKFPDVVSPLIDDKIPVPHSIRGLEKKKGHSLKISADFEELKQWLMRGNRITTN